MSPRKYKRPRAAPRRSFKPSVKSQVIYEGPGKSPGDYFEKFMPIFQQWAKLEANKVTKRIARDMVEEAKRILDNQTYNWKPLKEAYKKWKISKGLDERILIATGLYRDSIGYWVRKGQIHFGVPKTKKTAEGFPLHALARVHEFGTATIPARPLWRPLLSKYIRRNQDFRAMYYKAVNKSLKRWVAHETARRMFL